MGKLLNFIKDLKKIDSKGQVAVEYVLLFGLVIVMTLALMKEIKERMVGDIGNCQVRNQSMGCRLQRAIPQGGYESFRRFKVFK